MTANRKGPYGLAKRVQRPALARRVEIPILVPPRPWTTPEAVGLGLVAAGALTLLVCAAIREAA